MKNNIKKTILLVEDDSNDILLIKRAFKKLEINTRIETVTDGDAAVAYLSRQPPYTDKESHPFPLLILLDLKLPRRSGLEVLAWLRKQPKIKRTIVVILTSSRENPDIKKAYDLGVNSYLVKPVNFDELENLINSVESYWFKINEKPPLEW